MTSSSKIADDFVTIGRHPDSLAGLHKRANHTCAGMRLAGSWRALHRKDAAVRDGRETHRRRKGLFPRLLDRLAAYPRMFAASRDHAQLDSRPSPVMPLTDTYSANPN